MFRLELFVDDKNLGEAFKRLAGIARDLKHYYVPNVEPRRANGSIKLSAGDAGELITKELRKRHIKEVKGPDIRAIVEHLGLTKSSYSHHIQKLVENGVLKKGKKEGNSMNYIVQDK